MKWGGFVLAAGLTACRTPVETRPSGAPTKIAFLSDLHVTRGTNEEQTLHPGRLAKAISAVNRADVDLVLIAGDLTEKATPVEWEDFRKQIRVLEAPVWFVPGNHDVGNKRLTGTNGEVTFQSVVNYELKWGRSYFVREKAGVRVVGVNSALFGSGLPQERRMWRFLEEALAQPAALPTLLLLHHPPFLKKPDEKGGGYWNIEPEPRKRLLALLEQGEVKAVLSGHLHRPLTNHYQGILFLTTTGVAFGLPRGKQPFGWNLLTVSQDAVEVTFQMIGK
jgi:Icc protein